MSLLLEATSPTAGPSTGRRRMGRALEAPGRAAETPIGSGPSGAVVVDSSAGHPRRNLILALMCVSVVLVMAALSSVNAAIPSIRTQLATSDNELLWIIDLYALVFGGLLLPAGALGDRFGRKGMLQIGLLVFALSSVLASFTTSPLRLIAFRGLMGVGAALIMPSTLSMATDAFAPSERAKAIAVWTGFAGAGGMLGIIVGGFVLTHFWWGSVFLMAAPIGIVALIAVGALCPKSRDDEPPSLDVVGSALSLVGFGALLFTIIEAPVRGWLTSRSIVGFVIAVVGLVGFVAWERSRSQPMLDMKLFSNPRFGVGALAVASVSMVIFAMTFALELYLQTVRGYTPLRAGLSSMPFPFALIAVAPNTPRLVNRFGTKAVVVAGLSVLPVAMVAFMAFAPSSPYVLVAAAVALVGVAVGLVTPLASGLMLSLPPSKAGVGSAINDTTREVGGAIGIAVMGSLLNAQYRHGIRRSIDALPGSLREAGQVAWHGPGAVRQMASSVPTASRGAMDSLLGSARTEFVGAMRIGFLFAAFACASVAFLVALHYPSDEPEAVSESGDRRALVNA